MSSPQTRIIAALVLGSALLAAACTEEGSSPVGVELLPGGILAGGIQSLTLRDFGRAMDYEIFPSDRAESERLITAHAWPADPGFESRALFRFSFATIDSIPADVQVVEARLRLVYGPTPEEPVTFTIHRVTSEWGEEAATWERRLLGAAWSEPGGDFDPEPLLELTIGPDQPDSVAVDFPTDLIEDWRAGAAENHGVILVQQTPGTTVDFVSRGLLGGNINGPLLEVELELPGPSLRATILAIEDVFIVDDEQALTADGGLVVSGAEPVRRIFLDPALDAIPDGVTIAAARLVLTIDEARVPGDTLTVVARPVVSEFVGEKTVLGPVTPSTVLGAAVVPPDAMPGDTLSFESPALTRLVREWVADPATRRGIALTLVDERSAFGGVRFFGTGAAADVRPRIRLLYIPPSDPGLGGTSP
ncbi:MAG TPA: DNRLRE domain-containing protein [Gemmatimonadota bacterium]|nr:DNRLRE domain-containing protein [Gemmatimonadota bacterium]